MRILVVTFENPAVDAILNGMREDTLSGLPAFYYPLKMLMEKGHTVDILLYAEKKKEVVESQHFKRGNLFQICQKHKGAIAYLELPLRVAKETRSLLKRQYYDFVYGMTEGSYMAIREATRSGIPCGLRQFGTQEMANVLEPVHSMFLRRWKALKDYTYITLSMQSKKTFLLATNDGSRMDELFDILRIREKKYPFFFWRSGVHIPETQPRVDYKKCGQYPMAYDSMALSMVNRIADVKRQDRAVMILGELHRNGYPFHLYCIGEVSSQAMLNAAKQAAEDYGVTDYVHYLGGKSQRECWQYARNSFATILPCEWNRLNIFYEVMGEGALVITNDNHSIDEFIEPDTNCILYEEDNFRQAAEKIIALVDDPERIESIRTAAHQTAVKKFLSVEKRFGLEVQLIEDAAMGRDISQYPKVL